MPNECKPVQVSRRIEAPAESLFEILTEPRRHIDFDGSKMLRGAVSNDVISGVGEVFAMKMYFEPIGDYVMLNTVVEFETARRIGWEPAPGDAAFCPGWLLQGRGTCGSQMELRPRCEWPGRHHRYRDLRLSCSTRAASKGREQW